MAACELQRLLRGVPQLMPASKVWQTPRLKHPHKRESNNVLLASSQRADARTCDSSHGHVTQVQSAGVKQLLGAGLKHGLSIVWHFVLNRRPMRVETRVKRGGEAQGVDGREVALGGNST